MSMIAEYLPPNSEIRVHLHQHEDETIFIRMGHGIATLGDREVPIGPGTSLYVPQGAWYCLRNNGTHRAWGAALGDVPDPVIDLTP